MGQLYIDNNRGSKGDPYKKKGIESMDKDIIIKYLTAEIKKLEADVDDGRCADCGHSPYTDDDVINISFLQNKIEELKKESK